MFAELQAIVADRAGETPARHVHRAAAMLTSRSLSRAAAAPLLAAALPLFGCSSVATSGREVIAGESQFGIDGSQTLTSLAVGADGAIALTGSFDHTIDFGGGKLESAGGQDVFVAVLEPSGAHRWSGRTGSDYQQQGTGVALSPDGDLLLTGNFTGTVSFGQGMLTAMSPNAFLCRFDSAGTLIWSKKLGGDEGSVNVVGLGLAPDGGVVVGGGFSGTQNFGGGAVTAEGSTSFVARYDAQGRHVYSVAFAGVSNSVNSLAVDAQGGVILGGTNQGSITFGKPFTGGPAGSAFVGRLAPDGSPGWFVQLGGEARIASVAVSPKGEVVMGGYSTGTITFGDTSFPASGPDGSGAFVGRLSSSGAPLWFKPFSGASYNDGVSITAVAVDAAEHALFTGYLSGTVDLGGGPGASGAGAGHMFLAELDANGAYVRSKGFGGSSGSYGSAIAVDPAGGVVYGGKFSGLIEGTAHVHKSLSPGDLLVVRQPE